MRKGFTLIEVLVTSIILGFVLSGVAMFLLLTAQLANQSFVDSRAQNNLNLVYRDIANEIRYSKAVSASVNHDSLTISKINNTFVKYWFDSSNKKIMKKIGSSVFKEMSLVTTSGQVNEFDCRFSDDLANIKKAIIIDKLIYTVKLNGKTKTVSLTGHKTDQNYGTAIAVRND